jgi:YD repeat-containing protein
MNPANPAAAMAMTLMAVEGRFTAVACDGASERVCQRGAGGRKERLTSRLSARKRAFRVGDAAVPSGRSKL